jgi:hypothetical protein
VNCKGQSGRELPPLNFPLIFKEVKKKITENLKKRADEETNHLEKPNG